MWLFLRGHQLFNCSFDNVVDLRTGWNYSEAAGGLADDQADDLGVVESRACSVLEDPGDVFEAGSCCGTTTCTYLPTVTDHRFKNVARKLSKRHTNFLTRKTFRQKCRIIRILNPDIARLWQIPKKK